MNDNFLKLKTGEELAVDDKGYLLNWTRWSPRVAEAMAAADGMDLNSDHWEVLRIFREYYQQFEIEPPMRALVRKVGQRLGEEKGNSRYLYELFPGGPGTQACRYAGLPRPVSCI